MITSANFTLTCSIPSFLSNPLSFFFFFVARVLQFQPFCSVLISFRFSLRKRLHAKIRRCSSVRFSFPQKHRFLVFSFSEISLSNFQLFIVVLHYIRQGGIEFELLVSSRNTCFILCLILEEYRVWYLSFKYLREMYIVVCFDVTVTWKYWKNLKLKELWRICVE